MSTRSDLIWNRGYWCGIKNIIEGIGVLQLVDQCSWTVLPSNHILIRSGLMRILLPSVQFIRFAQEEHFRPAQTLLVYQLAMEVLEKIKSKAFLAIAQFISKYGIRKWLENKQNKISLLIIDVRQGSTHGLSSTVYYVQIMLLQFSFFRPLDHRATWIEATITNM